MPGQLGNAVKEERSRRATRVAEKMSADFRQKMLETRQSVLFEEQNGAYYTGYTPNYIKVYVPGRDLHNVLAPVELTEVYEDGMRGQLLNE